MKITISGLLAVVAVVALGGSVPAGVIYTQPLSANPSGQGGADSDSGAQKIADNFTLLASTAVTQVQWYGAYAGGSVPTGAESFQIRFFADSSGNPGSLLNQQTVFVTASMTGSNNSFGLPILFDASPLTAVPLNAGTPYWLSIIETDASTAATWDWQLSDGGDNTVRYTLNNGANWSSSTVSGGRGMAFSLLDTPAAAVPEPSSMTLLSLGAVSILGYWLRRRRAVTERIP